MTPENAEKRVLFINHSVRDGGPGRSLFYILKHIDRKIIRPFILIPRDDIFSERLKEEGIYRDVIVDPRFPDGLFRPWKENFLLKWADGSGFAASVITALLKIVSAAVNIARIASLVFTFGRIISERRIDLIHCNGTIAKITGAFIGLIHGCPVVWHVRNIQQTRFLRFVITRLASLSVVKKIICVSKATSVQFGTNAKVCVIYNGVDPEDFNPENRSKGVLRTQFSIPESSIVIGNTGRVVPRKSYLYMLEVASALLEKEWLFRGKLKFVIVGDTPGFFAKNHLSEIKERAREMGVADSFIFTGFRKDVTECLADFDIFFMPSNYPDPFPRSVIEAMSFAIPVAGFKVGGIEESVEDGVTGILSPPGDVSRMTESVRKLIDSADMRSLMGEAGRKRALSLYSAEKTAREIQSVLMEA